jgi:uncharacterized protein YjeT (DUF2065 family)
VIETLASAFALMLVIEGFLPLLAPKVWRETFRRVMLFNDGQLRFIGLLSIGVGLVVLVLVN